MENKFAGIIIKIDCSKTSIIGTEIVSIRETRNLARHDLTHRAVDLIWREMAKQNPAATFDTLDRNVDMVVEVADDMLKVHNVAEYRIGNILYRIEILRVKPGTEPADNYIRERVMDKNDKEQKQGGRSAPEQDDGLYRVMHDILMR